MKCSLCKYFSTEKPPVKNQSAQDRTHSGWCKALGCGTSPKMLRCGGEDFEKKPEPWQKSIPVTFKHPEVSFNVAFLAQTGIRRSTV